jgi:alpha-1,3-mannosyltransferase
MPPPPTTTRVTSTNGLAGSQGHSASAFSARPAAPVSRPRPVWWRDHDRAVAALLSVDALVCCLIVTFVVYTEIDWVAYMQEVEGFLSGELDYLKLKGDTGPLVYPAGFVYLFSVLYWITGNGSNIILAQWMWAGLYLAVTGIVMKLYQRAGAPPMLMVFLILSKRIHSIFMLRMFNDCVAMAFAYLAFLALTGKDRQGRPAPSWTRASILYSLGVSIKMNLFLFAPGIFYVWIRCLGAKQTAFQIAVCALVQVALGAPFLVSYPVSYVSKAFELSRVFTYKWTVNFKFLSEEMFVDPTLGKVLLLLTLLGWAGLYLRRWRHRDLESLRPALLLATVFESNIIGIAFSRTLHYQFYVWFFHQLPLILGFSGAELPGIVRMAVLAAVEVAFNVYPSTWWSSGLLTISLWLVAAACVFGRDLPKQWVALPPRQAAAAGTRAALP